MKSIAGMELLNVNYKAAVNMLNERIGNRKLAIDSHNMYLMDMPTAINKVSSLHVTDDTIEEHLKSLNVFGEEEKIPTKDK